MPRYNTEDERKAAHKEVVRRKNRSYYDKNIDKCREYGREYNKRRRANMTSEEKREQSVKGLMWKWKRWCREPLELIENYELAKKDGFTGWCIHHRLETHRYTDRTVMEKRDEDVPMSVLKFLGLYENRPANELLFMRNGDHTRLHNHKKGRFGSWKYKTPDEVAKSNKERADKRNAYYLQRCLYQGKEVSLGRLACILSKNGDKHPCQTARKYVIEPSLYSANGI